MEDQEILVRMGEEAEVLLDSEAFSSTINTLVDASFQTFSNTAPLESEKREEWLTTHTVPWLISSRHYASACQSKTKSSASPRTMTPINQKEREDHARRPEQAP